MKDRSKDIVPDRVFAAVCEAMNAFEETHTSQYRFLREFLTAHVQKTRSRSGWLFETNYRHGTTPAHSLIYALISTVAANSAAAKEVEQFFGASRLAAISHLLYESKGVIVVILGSRQAKTAARLVCYATAQHMLAIPNSVSDLNRAEMGKLLHEYLEVCAKFGVSREDVEAEARRIGGE